MFETSGTRADLLLDGRWEGCEEVGVHFAGAQQLGLLLLLLGALLNALQSQLFRYHFLSDAVRQCCQEARVDTIRKV